MVEEKNAHLKEQLDEELRYREDCIDKINRYKKCIKTIKEVNPYDDSSSLFSNENVDNMISIYRVNLSNWKSRLALTNERIHNLRMAIIYRNW